MKVKRVILAVLFISIFVCSKPAFCEFYKYDIRTIARKAQERIKDIDKKMEEAKQKEEAQKEVENLQPMLDEAATLFNEGRYGEAKALYSKVLTMTKNPEIRKIAHKANLESIEQKKAEEGKLREAKKKQSELKNQAKLKKQKEEKAKKEAELKLKKETQRYYTEASF